MEFDTVKECKNYARKYSESFNEEIPGTYAVANTFARLPKKLDVQAMKLFGLILSKLDYKNENKNENGIIEVICSLKEIIRSCGVESSYKGVNDFYKDLATNLMKASYLEAFLDDYTEFWGYAIQQVVKSEKDKDTLFRFRISNEMMPYFEKLANHYTLVRLENAKRFKSRFSYELYLNLLSWASPSYENKWDVRTYSTQQLKEMFNLDKDAYMYKDKFMRKMFEQKTIDLACAEINMYTDMCVSYSKIKQGKSVKLYSFVFTIQKQ